MDDYPGFQKQIFNSNINLYLNGLDNNLFSEINTEEDLLSYNDNLKYNTLFSGLDYNNINPNQKNTNRIYNNKYYMPNKNYINNNQNRQIHNMRERKEFQMFVPDSVNGLYKMNNKNQRYNNINYTNNINMMKGSAEIYNNLKQKDMIHTYYPMYNNSQTQKLKRKYYSKDEKIYMINNNSINNNKINNIYHNNAHFNNNNNYNNSINKEILDYTQNYNKLKIQDYINVNGKNMMINNQAMRKSNSNIGENSLDINNYKNINLNYRLINNKNNNKINNKNFISKNPAQLYNNSKYVNINNQIKNIGNIRDNILKNNNTFNRNNNIISHKKRDINKDEDIDEDINLSNIAEDLVETFKFSKKNNNNLNKPKNKNKNNILNQNIKKEKSEFGCQANIESEPNENKNINKDKQNNLKNINKIEISKPKIERKDEGIDIQTSLLQFIEPLAFHKNNVQNLNHTNNNNNNNINNKEQLDINNKNIVGENEKIKNNNSNNFIDNQKEEELISHHSLISSDNKKINQINEIKQSNDIQNINNNIYINSNIKINQKKEIKELMMENGAKESIIVDNNENNYIDNGNENKNEEENLFGEYIDSDKELELDMEEKNKKIKRHIKINLENNIYYNFLKGDLIKFCQIKKGKDGILENYKGKNNTDIRETKIVFKVKPVIKKFDKNNIKINKSYKLCENLREEEIIPDLFEDINEEVGNDNYVKELANSLRSSIDKSINSSINNSIRQSFNQSYNQSYADGIHDSIRGSKLKVSGGTILQRLTQYYNNSMAEDFMNENK